MVEISSQNNNSRDRNKIVLGIVLLSLISIPLIYVFGSKSYKTLNIKTQTDKFQGKSLNRETFNGEIIYQSGNKIVSLNTKNNIITNIGETEENDLLGAKWVYKNNKIFISSGAGVTRIDLSNNKKDFIAIVDDKTYTNWVKKISYFARADGIFPSPDGNKATVVVPSTGNIPNKLFLIDFTTNKANFLIASVGLPQWFSDSRYLFVGDNKASAVDTQTGVIKQIANLGKNTITISEEDYAFLWFNNKQINNPTNPLGESGRPDMILSSLKKTFPDISTQFHENDVITPFSKFPVIARDFKGVTKVLPGHQRNDFFVEIDDGKSNIYLTNGVPWGTFKRITPNNAHSYYLLDYNPITRKVLALKYRWIKKSYTEGTPEASLVILDEGNYAETVAGIDQSNFYEKEILKLDKAVTPTYYSRDGGATFSPDGKFVAAPLSVGGTGASNFKIISTEGEGEISITEDLGDHYYWIISL